MIYSDNMNNSTNTNSKSDTVRNDALNEARSVAPRFCEKCGSAYVDENFHLVQKNNNQSVFHLKCNHCGNTYILNVVSPGPNILASQRSSLNIDLSTPEEISKFAGKKSVQPDEVLDLFNLLKKSNLEKELSNLKK